MVKVNESKSFDFFYAFMFHIYLWLVQQITRFGSTKKATANTCHPSRLSSPLSALNWN